MEVFAFEKLKAYTYSRALLRSIYKLIESFPYTERNALTEQLQRAAISVPSNIAEGLSRKSNKAKLQFLEVFCQLQLARDLGYISNEDLETERKHITDTAQLISGLYSYIKKKSNL